jgi:ATP-dependent protease HslVU (ClpYQ) peptidase subunit
MSIVVAVRKDGQTCMAADTQNSFGANRVSHDNGGVTKLRRVGRAIVGTTGWGIYENILDDYLHAGDPPDLTSRTGIFTFFCALWKALHEHYPFVNDQGDRNDSPFGNLDASFLVAAETGIYYVAPDMSVSEFRQYFAVGSGADFSLGAAYNLYPQQIDASEIARRSVATASAFNLYCGGSIELMTTKS